MGSGCKRVERDATVKKFLVFALVLLGCAKPVAGLHYATPAHISTDSGEASACRDEVVIEQVVYGTYNVHWTDSDHKKHVVRTHRIVVTDPLVGECS
jgi:hypothetical protein